MFNYKPSTQSTQVENDLMVSSHTTVESFKIPWKFYGSNDSGIHKWKFHYSFIFCQMQYTYSIYKFKENSTIEDLF